MSADAGAGAGAAPGGLGRRLLRGAVSELGVAAKTFLAAMAALLLAQMFLYEPFWIPSGSMRPTLEVGDYLFVSKHAYGYSRYSFPYLHAVSPPLGDSGRVLAGSEQPVARGDIVVFKAPGEDGDATTFIKRVVGLPQEEVMVRRGVLHIGGRPVPRRLVRSGPLAAAEGGYGGDISEYVEVLPGGADHLIWEASDRDGTPPVVVPKGHYFVMGDNRDNSQDSRYPDIVGFVPLERIVGRAEVIFFSHRRDEGRVWHFWTWPSSLRLERFFTRTR